MLKEIAVIFLGDYPKVLEEIRAAIANRDAKQLENSAHTLKGSVANFGAAVVVSSALRLERMGRAAEFQETSEALRALEEGLGALRADLEAL